MTQITFLTMGDLSRSTGVPVRTIRFYCDEGLLASTRTSGGHRKFDGTSVDRLAQIRRLRALGLGLAAIADVLAGARSVADIVTAERIAIDVELATLAWRRASLRALEQVSPSQERARLESLAGVQTVHRGYDRVVAFWRGLLSPMQLDMFDSFVAMNIPSPPVEPTPAQVVSYASMVDLVADRSLGAMLSRQLWGTDRNVVRDGRVLVTGVADSCEVAYLALLDGRTPAPGVELDQFVEAHAVARTRRATPDFRGELLKDVTADRDPHVRQYWALVGDLAGTPVTTGDAHSWLVDALETDCQSL